MMQLHRAREQRPGDTKKVKQMQQEKEGNKRRRRQRVNLTMKVKQWGLWRRMKRDGVAKEEGRMQQKRNCLGLGKKMKTKPQKGWTLEACKYHNKDLLCRF